MTQASLLLKELRRDGTLSDVIIVDDELIVRSPR